MSNIRSLNCVGTSPVKYLKRDVWRPTDGKVFTVAFWFKRASGGSSKPYFISLRNWFSVFLDADSVRVEGYYGKFKSIETITDFTTWHHVTVSVDTTKVNADDRLKLYIDGVAATHGGAGDYSVPAQNQPVIETSATNYASYIGTDSGTSRFAGLIDEVYFIDTFQLPPSAFISGTPGASKDFVGAFGPQGFYLNFDQFNTVAAIGYDSSGHAIHFTPYNIVQANSSGDIPQQETTAIDLVVGSPVLGMPTFSTMALAANDLVVGSPETDIDPELIVIGENTFIAINLSVQNPVLGKPSLVSFYESDVGADWDSSTAARIGIGVIDSAGGWEGIVLADTAGAGPFEISQTIEKLDVPLVYKLAFDVAQQEHGNRLVEIGMSDGAAESAYAVFDPKTGAVLRRRSTIDFHLLGCEADPLRYGFYRLVVLVETNDATSLKAYIRLVDQSFNPDYTGDGTSYVFISDPMLLASLDARDFRWEIGAPEMRFFWTVHLSSLGLRWFRCGQGHLGVDSHLTIVSAPDLDCILRRWQPAQDQIVFDYSGMVIAGSGDPMAGTP